MKLRPILVLLAGITVPCAALGADSDTTGLASFLAMVNRPVALQLPGMDRVRVHADLVYRTVAGTTLRADVYEPAGAGGRRPIVLLLHGGVGPELMPRPKDWGSYRSWGRLLASSGFVAVTFNQRLGYPKPMLEEALSDVEALVRFVQEHAREWNGDPERMALVSYSAGGMLLAPPIRDRPAWLRGIVAMYPIIDLRGSAHLERQLTPDQIQRLSPGLHLARSAAGMAPLLLVRAGRDEIPDLLKGVDRFVSEALVANAPVALVNHPEAEHGFDNGDATPRTLEVLRLVLGFLHANLEAKRSGPSGP